MTTQLTTQRWSKARRLLAYFNPLRYRFLLGIVLGFFAGSVAIRAALLVRERREAKVYNPQDNFHTGCMIGYLSTHTKTDPAGRVLDYQASTVEAAKWCNEHFKL